MSTDKQTEALKLAQNWYDSGNENPDDFADMIKKVIALAEQPAQRTWIGVTDEEIEQVCVPLGAAMLSFTEVARAIEAKLKEKNGF